MAWLRLQLKWIDCHPFLKLLSGYGRLGCALLPPSADAPSAQKVPKGKKDKEGLQCFYHRQSQHHFRRRRHLLYGADHLNTATCVQPPI
jgi:hypothetical protein